MPYAIQRLVAAVALVVLSPLLTLVALACRATQGSPVLYRGERYGRHGKPFDQLKFRSMVVDADRFVADDASVDAGTPRVTKLGRVLRKTSLDELPQLINVARGDMALVGPRPLIDIIFERVDPQHTRFEVLPGITGLAQINGRNMAPWSQRLDMDASYVSSRSTVTDLRILVDTVQRVVVGAGVAPDRNPGDVLDI